MDAPPVPWLACAVTPTVRVTVALERQPTAALAERDAYVLLSGVLLEGYRSGQLRLPRPPPVDGGDSPLKWSTSEGFVVVEGPTGFVLLEGDDPAELGGALSILALGMLQGDMLEPWNPLVMGTDEALVRSYPEAAHA